ncbi:hypothetical protein YPPY45_0457, partial [Yersinia pestis PY-45]
GSILGRWWRYKWITFHPSLTGNGCWRWPAGAECITSIPLIFSSDISIMATILD